MDLELNQVISENTNTTNLGVYTNDVHEIFSLIENETSASTHFPDEFISTKSNLFKDPLFWKELRQKIVDQHVCEITLQKQELEQKSRLITDSIHYAKTIQSAILTSKEYFANVFSDFFVLYKPKDIVSGDFYWAFKTKSKKTFWCTADCTGHGVPGAFMTMIGNSLLNEIIIENEVEEVNLILDKLRDSVIKTLNKSSELTSLIDMNSNGMDIALCCWDEVKHELTFAGAHCSAIIVRNKQLIELKGDKQPIGLHKKMNPFQIQTMKLEKGDKIYTYSDGYIDQLGGDTNTRFTYANLKKLLLKIANKPMAIQKEELTKIHNFWKGNNDQIDDIVVVGVTIEN
jgi:serine phosphatase RsbU (regulator of sigma subunit)